MSWQDEHEQFIEQQVKGYLELSEESLLNRFQRKLYFDLPIILRAISRKCTPLTSIQVFSDAISKGTHDPILLSAFLLDKIHEVDPSFQCDPSNRAELLAKAQAILA